MMDAWILHLCVLPFLKTNVTCWSSERGSNALPSEKLFKDLLPAFLSFSNFGWQNWAFESSLVKRGIGIHAICQWFVKLKTSRIMTPCRTEKVDFSKKKKNTNRITKKTNRQEESPEETKKTRIKQEKNKTKQNLHFPRFCCFLFFSCFSLVLVF